MSTKESALEQLLASSMLVCCQGCGSMATYRGSPEKINAAMKEFYDLHERCRRQVDGARKERGG